MRKVKMNCFSIHLTSVEIADNGIGVRAELSPTHASVCAETHEHSNTRPSRHAAVVALILAGRMPRCSLNLVPATNSAHTFV